MCTFMTTLLAFCDHIFLLLIELGHQIDTGLYIMTEYFLSNFHISFVKVIPAVLDKLVKN